jgi:hypothetical protein
VPYVQGVVLARLPKGFTQINSWIDIAHTSHFA